MAKLPPGVPDVEKPGAAHTGPPAVTYYFPIPLGGKGTPGDPVTGVYLPNGFTCPDPVDVILHFHGDRWKESWAFSTINKYWGGNYPPGETYGPVVLRDDVNTAEKHAVAMIAPTLGTAPGNYDPDVIGDFNSKSAKGGFLVQVLQELAKKESKDPSNTDRTTTPGYDAKKPPGVGKIILSGHSGGGFPMVQQGKLLPPDSIREVWGFDCMYSDDDPKDWLGVIKKNPKADFYFHFAGNPKRSPTRLANQLEALVNKDGLKNVTFIPGPNDHFGTMTKNFLTRLIAAHWLK